MSGASQPALIIDLVELGAVRQRLTTRTILVWLLEDTLGGEGPVILPAPLDTPIRTSQPNGPTVYSALHQALEMARQGHSPHHLPIIRLLKADPAAFQKWLLCRRRRVDRESRAADDANLKADLAAFAAEEKSRLGSYPPVMPSPKSSRPTYSQWAKGHRARGHNVSLRLVRDWIRELRIAELTGRPKGARCKN